MAILSWPVHLEFPFTEIIPKVIYSFKMRIHPKIYELTVSKNSKKQQHPPLQVLEPVDRLPQGSVGIIAYNSAVRVYEYNVIPVDR